MMSLLGPPPLSGVLADTSPVSDTALGGNATSSGPATPSADEAPLFRRSAQRATEIDERVLVGAQRGDAEAVRAFIAHYERLVFSFLGRALGARNHADVDDLAQEVFLRAYRALPRFERRADAKISTWLLTIATRLVLDEKRRRPTLAERDFELVDPSTPEHERSRRALARAIEAALLLLPEDQRVTFVLAEFEDHSLDEIARITGVPSATVKTRLFRARSHLRRALSTHRGTP